MVKNVLKPEIRFKGFADAWEQRRFGDIFEFERPDKYMIEDDHYEDSGIPVLTANKAFILGYRNEKGAYDKGDCIIFDDFTLDSKYVDFPYKVNSSVIKILTSKDGSNLKFDYYLLNQAKILQQGHARHYISVVQPTEVKIPQKKESDEIERFFTNLDSLITLHQRKYERLQAVKKGLLVKMFPAEGENKPKIRFKGFSDAWEQRKLGDFVNVCSGQDYKHLSEGTVPVYGTGGYMLSVNAALSYDKDAVGIGRKGTIDKPYILRAPFWTVDTLFYCLPKGNNDLNFSFDVFQRINWKAKDESTGVPSLSKDAINAVEILVPTNSEQKTIGKLFQDLDSLITLHQRKCEKLKNMKKALLEKMFC